MQFKAKNSISKFCIGGLQKIICIFRKYTFATRSLCSFDVLLFSKAIAMESFLFLSELGDHTPGHPDMLHISSMSFKDAMEAFKKDAGFFSEKCVCNFFLRELKQMCLTAQISETVFFFRAADFYSEFHLLAKICAEEKLAPRD